jgi:ubiquinone/menaquinone biosynthesis C-methylase UbiE
MAIVDFGRHSDDYAIYRPGFPASFYDRVAGIVRIAGTRALDLGTGPGVMALDLAVRGAQVTGVDISDGQIAAARRVATARNLQDRVRFLVASAENTGLESASFELVTAGQCWHWFEGAAVMSEARRVLVDGGAVVVAHYSYLAEHSRVARDTEALILEFNPSWTMAGSSGIYPEQIDDLIHGGFKLVEQFCYQHSEAFTHARWCGRMRTCNGVGSGGLSPTQVEEFDGALSRLLVERFPDPMEVEHRVWCVIARKA